MIMGCDERHDPQTKNAGLGRGKRLIGRAPGRESTAGTEAETAETRIESRNLNSVGSLDSMQSYRGYSIERLLHA